ncbi:hypothetical protein FOIG_05553 [Fusarium odoratissimum NRRL 54006]|uniref:Uncharacterized protein n=1 Tax=Fusarium odoratissimum (strain NRRL 54006) TaxID=1089451 RepID=X0K5M7_FUSO5|nr:uncharacterized protein FOIG_05553 [Fusarium odoratissimum NRRL 54006]EXM03941.1 hypothetical protein FOIG_05553 [Fusarium odoratissimum NRRL 54006]
MLSSAFHFDYIRRMQVTACLTSKARRQDKAVLLVSNAYLVASRRAGLSEAQETQKCGGSGINNCLVLILQGAGSSTHNTQRSYTSLV